MNDDVPPPGRPVTLKGLLTVAFHLFAFLVAAGASGLAALVPSPEFEAWGVGAGLSAVFGFPTWLAAVAIAHRKHLSAFWFFAPAGLVAGFVGSSLFVIYAGMSGPGMFNLGWEIFGLLLVYALPGGTLGGITYWLIAVRPKRAVGQAGQ